MGWQLPGLLRMQQMGRHDIRLAQCHPHLSCMPFTCGIPHVALSVCPAQGHLQYAVCQRPPRLVGRLQQPGALHAVSASPPSLAPARLLRLLAAWPALLRSLLCC
jgi:hypothetical protein